VIRAARWIVAVLVLVGVGVVVVDDVATHRDLGDARAERELATQSARATEQTARRERATAEATSLAEIDRALAAEVARQESEAAGLPRRAPILTLAAGVPPCTAADLQLLNPQLSFLLFGNQGRPCGLLDHPGVEGRDASGTWVVVPVQYVDTPSYTDGAPWTGTFTNIASGVLGIYVEPVDRALGGCRTGTTATRHFDALRLVLAGAPKRLDLPGVTLDVGPCRPSVQLWAYDVGGEG
jgi:hypothetical protein